MTLHWTQCGVLYEQCVLDIHLLIRWANIYWPLSMCQALSQVLARTQGKNPKTKISVVMKLVICWGKIGKQTNKQTMCWVYWVQERGKAGKSHGEWGWGHVVINTVDPFELKETRKWPMQVSGGKSAPSTGSSWCKDHGVRICLDCSSNSKEDNVIKKQGSRAGKAGLWRSFEVIAMDSLLREEMRCLVVFEQEWHNLTGIKRINLVAMLNTDLVVKAHF